MNLSGFLFLASAVVSCLSVLGLIAIAASATLLRNDVSRAETFLSFTFLAATLGLSGVYLPIVTSIGSESQRAYFATPQSWFFLAALLMPHLFWFRRFRRSVPAALIATVASTAATPEFLSILSAA
jgi:hypothetical protein